MKKAPEWWIVGGLMLLAAGLRFWGFGRLGLTHFDEGIYAIAGFWSVLPGGLAGLDPQVIAYAPPGFPILVGLAYSVFGVADSSAIFVSIVCGILTVPAVAWLGRRTFGPGAGAASAAFAALAMAHIAFSRKALTDAPFLLCWIMAVGLGGRFLERPGLLRAIGFGLAVGLAQNFKYNGWIAGAIVIVAALFGLIRPKAHKRIYSEGHTPDFELFGLIRPEARKPGVVLRTFGYGLIAVLVAAACYWPWFAFVERHGGYAALVRHHQSYLGGVASWGHFWEMQLAQVVALSGGLGWGALTWAVAWIVATLAAGSRASWSGGLRWGFGLLTGAVVLAFAPDVGWWVGVGLVVPLLRDARPSRRVLGAWWLVMSMMTPLYHPYARLWLPLHAVGWLLMAGVVSFATASALSSVEWSRKALQPHLPKVLVAIPIVGIALGHWTEHRPLPRPFKEFFEPTDDFRVCVAELGAPPPSLVFDISPVRPGDIKNLRLLGRRPLAFYLAIQGKIPFVLEADEEGIVRLPIRDGEFALVDDALTETESHLTDMYDDGGWVEAERRWLSTLESWEIRYDPVTLLDVGPHAVFHSSESHSAKVWLLEPTNHPFHRRPVPPRAKAP